MKKVLYRLNASYSLGYGHVYRFRSLLSYLKMHDISVIINDDEEAYKILKEILIDEKIYRSKFSSDSKVGLDYYYTIIKENNIDCVIFDILDTSSDLILGIKEKFSNIKVISLDDNGTGSQYVDLRINGIVKPHIIYANTIFGLKYFIYNEKVQRLACLPKMQNKKVKDITVTFGGSDPMKISESLTFLFDCYKDITFNLVVGIGNLRKSFIEQLYKSNRNVNIMFNIDNLEEMLFLSDLAIISGGLTLYEAIALCTPAIVLCQVEHQVKTAERFATKGMVLNFGIYNDSLKNNIQSGIDKLISEFDTRKKMSDLMKQNRCLEGVYNVVNKINELMEVI